MDFATAFVKYFPNVMQVGTKMLITKLSQPTKPVSGGEIPATRRRDSGPLREAFAGRAQLPPGT